MRLLPRIGSVYLLSYRSPNLLAQLNKSLYIRVDQSIEVDNGVWQRFGYRGWGGRLWCSLARR